MLMVGSRTRAWQDLLDVFANSRPWRKLAMSDIRSKYRRTTIGPLWMTISTGVTTLSVGLIYGQFFGQSVRDYLPYLTASLVIWNFIAAVLNESSTVLVSASSIIKSSTIPVCFHNLRMVQRNTIIFLHNLIVLILLWPFVQWPVGLQTLLIVPALILLYGFLTGVSVVISLICVRYRDVPPMIQAVTQFLFFATPVVWYPEKLQFGRAILYANPIAAFLAITRDSLLGRPEDPTLWALAALSTALVLAFAAALYLRYRDRVAYWV